MGKGCSGCGSYGGVGGLGLGGYGGLGLGSYGKPGKAYSAVGMAYGSMMNQQNQTGNDPYSTWNTQKGVGMYPTANFSKMNPVIYKEENKSINPFANTPNSTTTPILQTMMPFNYTNIAGTYNQTKINYNPTIPQKQNKRY
jgi:hypothetical protein